MLAPAVTAVRRWVEHRFAKSSIKRLSFVVSLLSCLSAGSILLFSVFATAFHDQLGLSYSDCNTIASMSALAMYAPNAALGFAADAYGPPLLSVVAVVLFFPAYAGLAVLVASMEDGVIVSKYCLGTCFALVGIATSALYFGSVLTCAKIYPHSKGMAISLPVTCFGFSSLLGSQLMKRFHNPDGSLDLHKVFWFFAWLYLVIGAMSFVACSVVMAEQDVIFDEIMVMPSPETTPAPYGVDGTTTTTETEESPLLPQRSIEPKHHRARFIAFLKDESTWLLMVTLILSIGPMESFQNNLGSILKIRGGNLPDQVSVMAAASTAARLVMGAASDYLSSPSSPVQICRVWLVIIALITACIGQLAVVGYQGDFSPVSVVNGVGYGSMFTLFPALACEVWGVDFFGTSWGTFMIAPAVGSVVFSLFYGHEMDQGIGLAHYFSITSVSLFASAVLLLITWKVLWRKRRFDVF
ncbi:hypothetical protein DIURU_001486 [Diutina rugosa]|uniref:Probable transporter MCH1 n=1 Tax=Diutina rugosa TaxID=5481 RepID=A0A642UTY5_DIURU|nr:uncharacterized protein DIURU_001486 [Diutina rugosa]KAA8905413.1 hypothetical protein DIURU_001486 [Diutina rugosa]